MAWALWIALAQAFLWTPLLRKAVNAQWPTIHVEYSRAWSVWPGTVHARNLVITSQDRAVQWRLALDETTFSVALGHMMDRVFHATRVRANGVQFALRRRIRWPQAWGDRVEGLPLIEGLPKIPRSDEGPDDLLPDWRYRLWSVWLEDIAGTNVRQIWIDKVRVEGADAIAGSFYLKPIRELLVSPAELRFSHGVVYRDLDRLADAIRGSVRVKIGKINPKGIALARLFRSSDADVDLRAHSTLVEALGGRGGEGDARIALSVREGKVQRGSAIALDLAAGSLHGVHASSARLKLDVNESAHASVQLHAAGYPRAALRAGAVHFAASGPAPDLGDFQPLTFASVEVKDGKLEDARALGAWLLQDDRVQAGTGTFSAHLEGPPHRLSGSARASLSALEVMARGVRVRGDARVEARIAALDPTRGGDVSGTRISIAEARLIPDQEISPGWWGDFLLTRAAVAFPGPRLTAELEAQCRDARPIVGMYAHLKDLPGFLNSLFAMDGLKMHGSAEAGRGWFLLPELTASGNDASIRATLRQDQSGQRGAALLSTHGITVALDLRGGKSGLHLFGPGDFFAERQAEVRSAPPGRPAARRAPNRRR